MASIKVAVRVRPISAREIKITGPEVVVHTESQKISLINPKVPSSRTVDSRKRIKQFSFDYCFDSSDPTTDNYAGQDKIYKTLGTPVLDSFIGGYNASVVAYGQSASGKSYTMMGTNDDPGLIPRICNDIFLRASDEEKNGKILRFFVSYLEIYNEKVRDLLSTATNACLRIREHPRSGPYVEGLTQCQVDNISSLMSCLKEGTQARKTASTLQNLTSSRSHALLTLSLEFSNSASEHVSKAFEQSQKKNHMSRCKLHLVDLAGSEKSTACAGINRLKEGANINKSLVALGNVISALAERSSAEYVTGKRFIPYRDSTLTWLLKDSFGGNATTIMLATISPASGSYNETAHTLRFAQRAQSVINKPVVSEDPVSKIIRELQAEIAQLKAQLLEKNVEAIGKPLCACQRNQDTPYTQQNLIKQSIPSSPYFSDKFSCGAFPSVVLRRHSFDDRLTFKYPASNSIKKISSLESITDLKNWKFLRRNGNYNEAISKTYDNDLDEAFVDIPTLVAVLINPDTNVPEDSHQIDEIPANNTHGETHELTPITNTDEIESIKRDQPDEYHTAEDENENLQINLPSCRSLKKYKHEQKWPKRVCERVHLSELHLTESSEKLEDGCVQVAKNQVKETEKEKGKNNTAKHAFNDRETKSISQTQEVPAVKKQLVDHLERKTSVGSGSSSSKDDCPVAVGISKSTRRNSSDPEQLLSRPHTAIQRVRRAEIVAAVTERLYSSKKAVEDSSNTVSTAASEIRSPENSEVKFPPATRMRLREISRKMLAKRRRVCVDTQTDNFSTIRMRDAGISVEEPKIIQKDACILTDYHDNFESLLPCTTPVLRFKEISTSTVDTSLPKPTILLKDASSITEKCYDLSIPCPNSENNGTSETSTNTCPVDEPKNFCAQTSYPDVVIISDPNNKCETKCCNEHLDDKNVQYSCRTNSAVSCCSATSVNKNCISNESTGILNDGCCLKMYEPSCKCNLISSKCNLSNIEKNCISLSVPDTINITIESTNPVESTLQVLDSKDTTDSKYKDENSQTEYKLFSDVETWTEDIKKINIRESWTNTRLIDAYTNTRIFRFQKLLDVDARNDGDEIYSMSSTANTTFNSVNNPNNPYNLSELNTNLFNNTCEIKNPTEHFNTLLDSLSLDNENKMKQQRENGIINNHQSQATLINNNSFNYTTPISLKNKYNLLNLDAQSKFTVKARNVLRHYSWRNIRSMKFNNFDKKLRQLNRLNFGNQVKNINRRVSDILRSNNKFYYPKIIDANSVNQQDMNIVSDKFDCHEVKKTKAGENAIKVCDAIRQTQDDVKSGDERTDSVTNLDKSTMQTLIFPEQIYTLDDFNDYYIDLPGNFEKKLLHVSKEMLAAVNDIKLQFRNLFLIPMVISGNDVVNVRRRKSINGNRKPIESVNPIIIPNHQRKQNFSAPLSPLSSSSSTSSAPSDLKSDNGKSSRNNEFNCQPGLNDELTSTNLMQPSADPIKDDISEHEKDDSIDEEKLMKDYLKETIMFMRNINFMNELSESKAETLKNKKSFEKNDYTKKYSANSDSKKFSPSKLQNFLQLNEMALKKNTLAKMNSMKNENLPNAKSKKFRFKYNNKLIDINDDYTPLKIDNSTAKKYLDPKIFNSYLKLHDYSSRLKKYDYLDWNNIEKNKYIDNKLGNDIVDGNELNSQNMYLKITDNESALIERGRKLLSPSRYTIPKYDSANENSSSNEALANFIETLQANYRYKHKLKIPSSPRLKLMQLLSERRQIIENSRLIP